MLSRYEQELQLKQTLQNEKDQIATIETETGSGLGLPISSYIGEKALTSQGAKDALKTYLKTGNDEVDKQIADLIDNPKSANPIDFVKSISKTLGNKAKETVGDLVNNTSGEGNSILSGVRSRLRDVGDIRNDLSDGGDNFISNLRTNISQGARRLLARSNPQVLEDNGIQMRTLSSDINATFRNPAFDPESLEEDNQAASANSDVRDVFMARENPSNSTSNQIGDMLRQQRSEDITPTSSQQTEEINADLTNPSVDTTATTDTIDPEAPSPAIAAEPTEESITGNVENLVNTAGSTAADTVSSALEDASAVLDSDPITGILGGILGLGGIVGSLVGLFQKHSHEVNPNGIGLPAFTPGL